MTTRPKREGVMLAYPVDPGRISRLGNRFFAQPKLNGERCRVEWFHGEPVLMSSYANVIKGLAHIEEQIKVLSKAYCKLFADVVAPPKFDGELYIHGWTWSQIVSVTGRTVNEHPSAGRMEYHIFDIQDEYTPQVIRFHWLSQLDETFQKSQNLTRVATTVTDEEEWGHVAQSYVDAGYEGIILRDAQAQYHYKRNVCLLKYKPTESDDYTIVEVLEAISQEGDPKGMVGAFLVHGDDGTVFKVGAGKMNHPRRIELWEKREFLTGLDLKVKHEKLRTVNAIPIAAVAVDIEGV